MTDVKGYPYKGHTVFPRLEKQSSGEYAACFTIQAGKDGAGEIRYARTMPTNEFLLEDDAIAYILDFAGDWIDANPL